MTVPLELGREVAILARVSRLWEVSTRVAVPPLGAANRRPWMRESADSLRRNVQRSGVASWQPKPVKPDPAGAQGPRPQESAAMRQNLAPIPFLCPFNESDADGCGLSKADRDAVRHVVNQAPPLAPEQRERLAAVLGGGAKRRTRAPVAA